MPNKRRQQDLRMWTVRDFELCLADAWAQNSLPTIETHSVKRSKDVGECEGNNGKMRKPCGLCACRLH